MASTDDSRRRGGHGACREGLTPSGKRSGSRWCCHPQVRIDYGKLRELCRRCTHDDFMAAYPTIFTSQTAKSTQTSVKQHSCGPPSPAPEKSTRVSSHKKTIPRTDQPRGRVATDTSTGLSAMLSICRKLPIQRSSAEVSQLTQCLAYFPELLPGKPSQAVLKGIAARALGESVSAGRSLPWQGGITLVLQGSVQQMKSDMDTNILTAGNHFGELELQQAPLKSSYPYFFSLEPCILMRITAFDYQRVMQKCQSAATTERQNLLSSCPLLHGVSPSVLSKLAEAITWETIKADTCLVREGDRLERVAFIQSGHCTAQAQVPGTSRSDHVLVGELVEGNCVGEGLLYGAEKQPYTITTASRVRLGWVSAVALRVNEIEKHILSDKAIALPLLSKDQLRQILATKLMKRQWKKIKEDITQEVLTERGILHGMSKWRHSGHKPDGSISHK